MPYCTRADIEGPLIPSRQFIELCDDENEGASNKQIATRVNEAIILADEEIDAELIEHYDVPFEEDEVPAIIKQISARLAADRIWGRRDGYEPPDRIVREVKWARAKIKEYKNRASQLTKNDPHVGGTPKVSKTDADRVFTEDLLKKMP